MEEKTPSVLRFSNVVENYVKYRPGYPKGIIQVLEKKTGMSPNSIVADIGSGTGKSSELFIKNDNVVYGVEPNDAMRAAAEEDFRSYTNFISVKGTAENTTLASHSADLIIAGQAFHWFNPQETYKEFSRVLKHGGWVALIWNERNSQTPFLKAYENFVCDNSIDYAEVNHKNVDESALRNFFGDNSFVYAQLHNAQHFNFESLKGRYLSSSYAYKEDHPLFANAMKKLETIYTELEENGLLKMELITKIYLGQLVKA